MRQCDFINELKAWEEQYRRDLRPLRLEADRAKDGYEQYDQEYECHLEELHTLVQGYLQDEGLVEPIDQPAS